MGYEATAGEVEKTSAPDRRQPPASSSPRRAAAAEHRETELLLKAHAELAENAQRATLDELIQLALGKAESLTGSTISFFHFVDADQENLTLQTWSANTSAHLCQASGKGQHYPISQAGVWCDCLRTGAPVVHNDYASLPHRKGLPPGHAPIVRELVIPVQRDGAAVAILGVGNKPDDYTDGDVTLVTGIANLIADYALRKRAEIALRTSEARLATAQRLAHIGSWEWDLTNDHAEWSEETFRIFGLPPARLTDHHQYFLDCLDPADRAKVNQALQDALQGTKEYDLEYRISSPNGAKKVIHAQAEVLRDETGKPIFMRGTVQDITGRKLLEEQLREAQKLESVGRLAGGFAHDFNNLLSSTMMNLGLLQDNPNLDGDTREILKDLAEQAKRAAALTRQLLMFSRRAVLEVKVIDLNELVANLLKMLGRLLGEDVIVQFHRTGQLPPLEGDAGLLEQVVVNLAVNARDAMPNGGRISIGIESFQADAERVKGHPQARPGPFLCLSMTDTGCGMDAATLERIFEPFFTTKEAGKGTGLGLATVYGIIAQHKGWVEVQSEVGRGTTFRVYLPTADADAALYAGLLEDLPLLQGTETILLVEDENGVRRLVANGLRRMGYNVIEAANGPEALQCWYENGSRVDLLFTDMVMPGQISGLELAVKLRAEKPALKIIISSGYTTEMGGRTVMPPGIVHFQKPYQLAHLSYTVRQCLDTGKARSAP